MDDQSSFGSTTSVVPWIGLIGVVTLLIAISAAVTYTLLNWKISGHILHFYGITSLCKSMQLSLPSC